jgi:hypothetical protein
MEEVIDIGAPNIEPISLDFKKHDETTPSVNFGTGIELLMNDKKKTTSVANLDLGELDDLEDELNQLSGNKEIHTSKPEEAAGGNFFSGYFGSTTTPNIVKEDTTNAPDIQLDDLNDANLGSATSGMMGTAKTWDGFTKASEVPTNQEFRPSANMNERDKRRKKRMMLKKLSDWQEKGMLKDSGNFSMDTPYDEIEDEYEGAMEEKRKKDSVKLQGWWFMTFINSLEYGNAIFNPFDLNLDGWGEQVSEDLDSYEEIFLELHDKYKGGKMAPEISLMLRLGFSAAVLNFSNKALSTATPAFNDVIKQSPELMKMFTNATVNSMTQDSPGFAMANNFMEDNSRPKGPPPPAPVETKNIPPPPRPGMNGNAPSNRPDMNASRGTMFREEGVRLEPAAELKTATSMPTRRPEMKGPQNSDIDNILSGLKTRTVNIHNEPKRDDDSLLSISSLKDIQNNNMPKKGKRRNGSEKNVISLDL